MLTDLNKEREDCAPAGNWIGRREEGGGGRKVGEENGGAEGRRGRRKGKNGG